MSSTLTQTQTTVEWWTADPARTKVEFEVEHFWGLHTVRGRFRRFDGVYVVGHGRPGDRADDRRRERRHRHLGARQASPVSRLLRRRRASAGAVHVDAGQRTRERAGTGERRAGRGRHERSSRVRRIGADDRRRARARGDDDGRPALVRHEPGPAPQHPAADEAAREGAPRTTTARLAVARDGADATISAVREADPTGTRPGGGRRSARAAPRAGSRSRAAC